MSFDANEKSVQDAAPVELYTFRAYNTFHRFTSQATDIVVQSQSYQAAAIRRSSVSQTSELPRNAMTLRTAPDFPVTTYYEGVPPSTVILLTIARIHRGDTAAQPIWNGRVLNCKWERDEAVFHCESVYTSLRRTGLRRLYGRGCPYVLYGSQCGADEAAHRIDVTVESVSGTTVQASALAGQPDGRWIGGFLSFEHVAGNVIRRGITDHSGDTIELTHRIPELSGGDAVRVHPGCAHDLADCNDFFANAENYGGLAPYLAGKNPFGGNSVF